MSKNRFTTADEGFDYMANNDVEEQDRDTLGILFAVAVMAVITVSQYLGMI